MAQKDEIFGGLIIEYVIDPKSNKRSSNVLLVETRLPNGKLNIINAFDGTEAKELYDKLTTKKGK